MPCYAMPGTELLPSYTHAMRYPALTTRTDRAYGAMACYEMPGTVIRCPVLMPGTDLACAAPRMTT
eukprot:2884082-Rhodomonas_salina.3